MDGARNSYGNERKKTGPVLQRDLEEVAGNPCATIHNRLLRLCNDF
jgi:hypothetical protein